MTNESVADLEAVEDFFAECAEYWGDDTPERIQRTVDRLRERVGEMEVALEDIEAAARNCRTMNIDQPRDCFASIEEIARQALDNQQSADISS